MENLKKKKRDKSDDGEELRAEIEDEKIKKQKKKIKSEIGIMSDQSFFSLPLSKPTIDGITDLRFSNMTQVFFFHVIIIPR